MRTVVLLAPIVVALLGGCGSSADPAVDPSTASASPILSPTAQSTMGSMSTEVPPSGDGSPAKTSPPHQEKLPEELVGGWIASSGGAEIIYRFASDGTYKHVGVLLQRRPSGMASFTVADSGTAAVDGDSLVLRPRRATKSLHDPDSPGSSYDERPSSLAPQHYTWRLDAAERVLTLDDGTGLAVDYERE